MSAFKNINRKGVKRVKEFNAYFALKSKDEMYYQMASVFTEIRNENKMSSQTALIDFLSGNVSKTFMENQF